MGSATLLGGLTGTAAHAASHSGKAHQAGLQGGYFYRYPVGKFQVFVLTDGYLRFPSHPTFGKEDASKEEVQSVLRAHYRDPEFIDAQLNLTLIDTGSSRILVDTGYGERGGATSGWLKESLKAAGYSPEDIDHILISHAHPDHLYGLTRKSGESVFPNASVWIHHKEKQFWTRTADELEAMAAAENPQAGMLQNINSIFAGVADRIQLFDTPTELIPGVRTLELFGHTPGHSGLMLESEDQRILVLADTANHEILMTVEPDWPFGFDHDPVATAKTRREVFGVAADQKIPCIGYHWSYPGIAYIGREGNAFRWHPTPWSWS